jgi:hypothetical protein
MKYRVPVRFVIHGHIDVSASDYATNTELQRIADEKSGDVIDRMMAHSSGGGSHGETFASRTNIRIVRTRR